MIEPLKVSDHGEWYSIFGQRFATREAAEKHRDKRIAYLNQLAGRKLSDRELLSGPVKVDDRRTAQKILDEGWKVVTDDEEFVDDNPFRKKKSAPKDPREAIRQQQEAAWDAKKTDAERRAAMEADPARKRAVKFAEDHLEKMTYSDASYSDVVRAQKLLSQAKGGTLDHFNVMAENVVAKEADRCAEKRAAIEKRIHADQKLLDTLAPLTAPNAPPQPMPQPREELIRNAVLSCEKVIEL